MRKWLKKRLCNPLQGFKQAVPRNGLLYNIACRFEWLIVGGGWMGIAEIIHRSASGEILSREFAYNDTTAVNGGEQALLECFFCGSDASNAYEPSTFQVGLFYGTMSRTTVLSGITASEPSGNGYARASLARSATAWPTRALDGGYFQVVSTTFTFSASGGSVGPFNTVCLIATINSVQRLIAFYDITERSIAAGETIDMTYGIKLK
jgi:hypothetical protein